MAESFLHGFSSMEKHCSYIQVLISPLCGESRRVAGLFGIPPFFRWVYFVGRFSPWFQLYGEALLIHFIQFYVPHCGKVPGGRERFRDPLLFFGGLASSESFLHGFSSMEKHCSYISFFRRLRRGSLGGNLRGVLFSYGVFRFFGEELCIAFNFIIERWRFHE